MLMEPTSLARTRALKRPRTQAELSAQAARFGADWQRGDKVMTWIRRHEAIDGELTRLVRDGWSWADVGRAMALAGIKYETGQALSSAVLQRKATKARADERKRRVALVAGPPAEVAGAKTRATMSPPVPVSQPSLSVPAFEPQSEFEDDEPAFRPARLARHWSGKIIKQDDKPSAMDSPVAEPATGDTAEVIARLLGKK